MISFYSLFYLFKCSEVDFEEEEEEVEKDDGDLLLNFFFSVFILLSLFDDGFFYFEVIDDSVLNQYSEGVLILEFDQLQDSGRFIFVFVKEIVLFLKEDNDFFFDKNFLSILYQFKKNIGRSVSLASVFQRERRLVSVIKEENRKYSLI